MQYLIANLSFNMEFSLEMGEWLEAQWMATESCAGYKIIICYNERPLSAAGQGDRVPSI